MGIAKRLWQCRRPTHTHNTKVITYFLQIEFCMLRKHKSTNLVVHVIIVQFSYPASYRLDFSYNIQIETTCISFMLHIVSSFTYSNGLQMVSMNGTGKQMGTQGQAQHIQNLWGGIERWGQIVESQLQVHTHIIQANSYLVSLASLFLYIVNVCIKCTHCKLNRLWRMNVSINILFIHIPTLAKCECVCWCCCRNAFCWRSAIGVHRHTS